MLKIEEIVCSGVLFFSLVSLGSQSYGGIIAIDEMVPVSSGDPLHAIAWFAGFGPEVRLLSKVSLPAVEAMLRVTGEFDPDQMKIRNRGFHCCGFSV